MSYSAGSSTSFDCASASGKRERIGNFDLSSYKLINGSYSVEMDYEGKAVLCHCKLKAPRWSSWTFRNPGRRFYGCHRYPEFDCGFHSWHDPKFLDRATEIICELRKRERQLYEYVKNLKDEVEDYKDNAVELVQVEVIEENFLLKSEVSNLRLKLKEMEKTISRNGTDRNGNVIRKTRIVLFLCVILVLFVCVLNSKKAGNMYVQFALP